MGRKGNIALVDDHVLLRNGLTQLIKEMGYCVSLEANNGKDFIEKLNPNSLPDIVLLDLNMPVMDGYETANWLKKNYPQIKILALSMNDNDIAIIRMLKIGARGYVLKDTDPSQLKLALDEILEKGFYYSEMVTNKLIYVISDGEENNSPANEKIKLSEKEKEFLKYTCTELTYKEIAAKLFVSPRTVDGYRDNLFEKLNVKTRIGLAIYAIRSGITKV
ncbi:MAG TPA: response regulator transcription factor [Chitinophagaceae bacterium]|nr:response regulator transcription factor [Chitinophagaceae bacterium]